MRERTHQKKKPWPKSWWVAFDGEDDALGTFRTKQAAKGFAEDEHRLHGGVYTVRRYDAAQDVSTGQTKK